MSKVFSMVKRFVFAGAAVMSFVAVQSANTTVVPGCGNGLDLTFSPGLEALVAENNQGNVNWDGYVCYKPIGRPGYIIVIDNRSEGGD